MDSCPHCGAVLSAAARFCHACGRAQGGAADVPPLTATEPPAPPHAAAAVADAERRQLTVMFCDLVGSTELSQRLDPEDLREVVRAYQETCAGVIHQYEGYLAKYLGDGLLVHFGYPAAHEDDAERAVRAGLAIVGELGRLNTRLERGPGIQLAVRIGIHTGLVVAGAMGAEAQPEPLAIVGETPNIASRVQSVAEPNTVVMTSATQRLVAGLFIVEERGAHSLKGVRAASYALPGTPTERRAKPSRCRRRTLPHTVGGTRGRVASCCASAGSRRARARDRWSSSPAKRASANHASSRR